MRWKRKVAGCCWSPWVTRPIIWIRSSGWQVSPHGAGECEGNQCERRGLRGDSDEEHRVGRTPAALGRRLPYPGAVTARDWRRCPERSGAFESIATTTICLWHGGALTLGTHQPFSHQLSAPQLEFTCCTRLLHPQVHAVTGLLLLHQHVWSPPGVLEVPLERVGQDLCHLFRCTANSVVAKATSTLFEIGTGRASVSGGNRYLPTPLCAANSTRRRAWRPRTPRAHHTVNGRYLAHALIVLAAVPGFLTVCIAVAHGFSLGVLKTLVIPAGAAVRALSLPAARFNPLDELPAEKHQIAKDDQTETRWAPSMRSHDGHLSDNTCPVHAGLYVFLRWRNNLERKSAIVLFLFKF